eukprot:CAMPEP_0119539600 /NCGR_PEP_ID=MMETSP1344-20130328/51701_1 /TAXON_ID=236787 /ORGANISM="Florenciella parvula, Strain CCMP2471" /LENGTH=31 /DNA_ID= /DNA_START= /DNA_END= /DNA_ORIENTATION=
MGSGGRPQICVSDSGMSGGKGGGKRMAEVRL